MRRHALLIIALAAVAHGLVYLPFEEHLTGDSATYLAAANALRVGSYSTPLRAGAAPATGYSSHPGVPVDLTDHPLPPDLLDAPEHQVWRAPVYPALIAIVGGAEEPGPSRNLLYGVQALLIGVSTLLAGALASRLWSPRVGVAAAALVALDPFSKRYAGLVLSEALAMALASLAAYALVRAWTSAGLRWWTTAGVAAGLLALTRPGLSPVVPILLVAAALRTGAARQRAARAATVLLTSALIVTPWLAWTAAVTGTPTLQAYGQGVNLLVAARGQGPGTSIFMVAQSKRFVDDVELATSAFPDSEALARDPGAHARYLVTVDRSLRDRAISGYRQRLRSHPSRTIRDYGWRASVMWMANSDWYQPSGGPLLLALRAADWLVLSVTLGGILVAAGRAPARALGAILILSTLILALSEAQARFTIPLRPLAFAFAGYALVQAFEPAIRVRNMLRARSRPAIAS